MSDLDVPLRLVETLDEAVAFRSWLGERRPVLAVDTETGGLDWWKLKEPRLVQFGDARSGWSLPWHWWQALIREVLPVYSGPVVFHNAKFDLHFLGPNASAPPTTGIHDTMLMAYILDASSPVGLKSLAARLIAPEARRGEAALHQAMQTGKWDWDTVPVDLPEYWAYAALDCVLTARMFELLEPQLYGDARECYETEIATMHLLVRSEERGMRVDRDYCTRERQPLLDRAEALAVDARERWGVPQLTANRAVALALEADGVQLTVRTAAGAPKLDEAVLSTITHPLASAVLEYRDLTKVANTYLSNYLELCDPNGQIHPDIRQIGAARTGRMSASRPNLQNVPRTKQARSPFLPSEGNRLVLCDYDQMEFRLIAADAQEPSLMDAIHRGEDLHQTVADLIGCTRQLAKGINYGLGYGAGAAKIALISGASEGEVRVFLDAYWGRFPRVRPYMDTVIAAIRDRGKQNDGLGYVNTLFGRRPLVQTDKAYAGVNYRIQGSCADILKRKLVDLDNLGLGDYFVLPVHDEVVFDVPADEAEEVMELVSETLLFEYNGVPLTASGTIVDCWGDKYA